VRAALKNVNSESAARRKKLEALEAQETERQNAALTETDRLKKELESERVTRQQLEAASKNDRIQAAVLLEAVKLGFEHPEDAARLVDLAAVEITEGKVTGYEKSLKALAESGRLPIKGQKVSPGLGTPKGGPKATGQPEQVIPKIRL